MICATLVALPLGGAPVYSVVKLGSLSGARSEAFGAGAGGLAAGTSRTAETSTDLPVAFDEATIRILSSTPGHAAAISNSGTVVGTTYTSSGPRATVWTEDGEELLPTLGGGPSYGLAISNAGYVAGSAITATGVAHAFLAIGDSVRDLGTLGGDWSAAYGINDSLQVTGYSQTASGTFGAFVWNPETGMLAIPKLGGANSYAFGINASGSVVGSASTLRGTMEGFLYQHGETRPLGTLGGYGSYAYGINARSQVVGYSYDRRGGARAFVWFDGVMFDLNAICAGLEGWTLDAAYGINDRGQIVGTGTYQGLATAFRLDPISQGSRAAFPQIPLDSPAAVPEPGTSILLLFGTVLLWLWRTDRRRRSVARRMPLAGDTPGAVDGCS
jgi:probable HAF family extracellular repeat protein